MRARQIFAAGCSWLALSCSAHSADVFRLVDFEQHLDRPLPLSTMLRDATGNMVPLGRYFGGPPVLLVLGYARCPNLCGTAFIGVNEALRQSGLRLNTDVRSLFISIDLAEMQDDAMSRRPEAELKAWHFLRGDDASIRQVADAVGFRYVYDPQIKQYAHPAGFVVVAPDGRIARYFFGVRFPPTMLRLAVTEASHGKSGSLADRLLLLCYHYDPQAGRYNLAIIQSLRILSVTLLLGLGSFFWYQHRAGKGLR